MTTKRTIITKRVISKILGRRIDGWNDKRKSHNRIKLTERLSYNEMSKLESDLTYMYPEFRFAFGDVRWKSTWPGPARIVTAITFWK